MLSFFKIYSPFFLAGMLPFLINSRAPVILYTLNIFSGTCAILSLMASGMRWAGTIVLLKTLFPVGKFKLNLNLNNIFCLCWFWRILKVPKVSKSSINGQIPGTDFTNNGLNTQTIELAVVFEREVIQLYYTLCSKLQIEQNSTLWLSGPWKMAHKKYQGKLISQP